jgi:hypothetical protein
LLLQIALKIFQLLLSLLPGTIQQCLDLAFNAGGLGQLIHIDNGDPARAGFAGLGLGSGVGRTAAGQEQAQGQKQDPEQGDMGRSVHWALPCLSCCRFQVVASFRRE